MATPNLYHLAGHGIHVTYSTTSITGKAMFTYQDAQGTHSFSGDQIKAIESPLGSLVTVTVRMTVDTGSTTFSVLIPRVNLGTTNTAHITTEGITTVHRFSIVPAFNTGQLDLYSVHGLHGTASAVAF